MAPYTGTQTIDGVIGNEDGIYDGDLIHYFGEIFFTAQNLWHPYHNFRHMFHVLWTCYKACTYYAAKGMLNRRDVRTILVAAIVHDVNHSGLTGDDDLNIERSVRWLGKHYDPCDASHLETIGGLVRLTEFPHQVDSSKLSLGAQILRDADLSQALSVAWLQQVVFGLAREWGKRPYEVLAMQKVFLSPLKFSTEWAQQEFPQEAIDEKVKEAEGLRAKLDAYLAAKATASKA